MKVKSHMQENEIEVREYDVVSSDVILLASNQLTSSFVQTNKTEEDGDNLIWIDSRCCFALYSKLNRDQVLLKPSPLALPKALKVVHTTQTVLIVKILMRTATCIKMKGISALSLFK